MGEVSSTEQIRQQLDAIGARRREHKRLRAEAAHDARRWIPAAVAAGVPVAEISRRADLTRAAIYTLLAELEHKTTD